MRTLAAEGARDLNLASGRSVRRRSVETLHAREADGDSVEIDARYIGGKTADARLGGVEPEFRFVQDIS